MIIANKPQNNDAFTFNLYKFSAAREALAKVLDIVGFDRKILIPAFIGYSVREGSGIFDPIRHAGIGYEFYSMDCQLMIDKENLLGKIRNNPGAILLLVHYWGFVDPFCNVIKQAAREHGCIVVEDFAHGLFTFFKNPNVDFDYGFFSLHKMFPYKSGGVLISKNVIPGIAKYDLGFFEYNLAEISRIRVENYLYLQSVLNEFSCQSITVLRPYIGNNIPQTFPVLLKNNALKDFLYFKMNAAGFGVVSLYHQLISEVTDDYKNEQEISSRILNLPIHQDVDRQALKEMVNFLMATCEEYEQHD